ncbi:MAG: hypothetical protein Q8P32_02310 [Candidatus Komeilibacteria bacterium]|nr:hypothetical protein [Candidatus Komeilibacteria bacterium]
MNSIKECFAIILNSNEKDSRLAARQVRKLLYTAQGRDERKDTNKIINTAPQNYAQIKDDWRQENFVLAISVIYFTHDKEEQPDFLFPWLFQLLIHQNGVIRYAAVRMLENEIWPLTAHIRFPGHPGGYYGELKPALADSIIYSLLLKLNELSADLYRPAYKKYKYVDSLPASPYKSVQMVLAQLEELSSSNYVDSFNR